MKIISGYLHSYEEAYLVVHALRLGFVQPNRERLSLQEREEISSGNIYVFIERKTLIMRWTDGITWSPSKILGSFLLYKEVCKYMTKNATKKYVKKKYERQRCVPLDKQLQKDRFFMHKKTISLKHGNETYHIIAYFQPVFDKRGISKLPFFISLQNSLKKYPELYDDNFVKQLFDRNVNISKCYEILEFNSQNLRPNIDRVQLTKDAINILAKGFL